MNKVIEKPWGSETIIETNPNYTVKRLFMYEGKCCSLQYHKEKKETIYVLLGTLKIIYGLDQDNLTEIILNSNESITLDPFIIHRMFGVTDCYYLESSTSQLEDVVRLQDLYGRVQ
jgi:mannose-6-phosphate isomerase-like protein (cupin superfamily)